MAKLRTVIVDDEPLALKLLGSLLRNNEYIEVVGECRNGREAVAAAAQLRPDLLILDIQMPGLNGFDVIKKLQSDLVPLVIFCTAYQRYAIDAFDLHVVDYVLKPVNQERLDLALQRAAARFEKALPGEDNKAQLIGAIDDITHRAGGRRLDEEPGPLSGAPALAADRKIAIPDAGKILMVDVDDIYWVDAAGDYMCLHIDGVTHILRSTMKTLSARLDQQKFRRIHRSTIVNMERIRQVTSQPRGEYLVELDCGAELKVSRNFREAIKEYLQAH